MAVRYQDHFSILICRGTTGPDVSLKGQTRFYALLHQERQAQSEGKGYQVGRHIHISN